MSVEAKESMKHSVYHFLFNSSCVKELVKHNSILIKIKFIMNESK